MPPAIRRNSLSDSPPTSPRSNAARNAASSSFVPPSLQELSLEQPTELSSANAVFALAPSGVNRFRNMPPPVVFHLQSFLERPEVVVFSTVSGALHAVTTRTPDPLLGDYFAVQRQVGAQAADPRLLVSDVHVRELVAMFRNVFTRRDLPAAPTALNHVRIFSTLLAIVQEKVQRDRTIHLQEAYATNRVLLAKWLTSIASTVAAKLDARPWEGDVIHEAVRSLCGLGRTREAEQVLRWRLLWHPSDAAAQRQLVDVLLQARQYGPAADAMRVRNQLCATEDRNTWVCLFEMDGDTKRADMVLWTNTKAPIAQAMLLQGSAWGAYHQIDDLLTADPFTVAVIEHGLGHDAQAQAAFARISDNVERALFHAWQGNAQLASKTMNTELEGADWSTFRRVLDVLHSPFLEPIRDAPQWQDFMSRFDLTPEKLAKIPFDVSCIDPECTRRNAELKILENLERAQQAFAQDPADGHATALAIELVYLGRLEMAEQMLRWEIERDPDHTRPRSWLDAVLLAMGRPEDDEVETGVVGIGRSWSPFWRHPLLSGQARAVYDKEAATRDPDRELMAMAAHTLGLHQERDALIAELKHSLTSVAIVRAWAGQADEALESLHHLIATGHACEILRKVVHSPFIEPLRRDPRWLTFLRSINMAPEQLAAISVQFELPALPLPEVPDDGS